MDYLKIYKSFIDDRLQKQGNLVKSNSYFEKHHILPKSLGGKDIKSNIVCLSPEDHFFAHILLAKIYGGKMMRALFAMANFKNTHRDNYNFKKRMQYGHIRRLVAKEYSEKYSKYNSSRFDSKIYHLKNHDGRVATGNRFEIEEVTGLKRSSISQIIKGEKLNYKGWYFPPMNNGKNRKQLILEKSIVVCRKIYKLYHYDGRSWSGIKTEFKNQFGRRLYFQTKNGCCAGWYLTKLDAENHFENIKAKSLIASNSRGSISGLNNPRSDKTVYDWINFETRETKRATRYEMSVFLGLNNPGKMSCIFSRKQKSIRGWGLYDVYKIKDKIKVYLKHRHGDDFARCKNVK